MTLFPQTLETPISQAETISIMGLDQAIDHKIKDLGLN